MSWFSLFVMGPCRSRSEGVCDCAAHGEIESVSRPHLPTGPRDKAPYPPLDRQTKPPTPHWTNGHFVLSDIIHCSMCTGYSLIMAAFPRFAKSFLANLGNAANIIILLQKKCITSTVSVVPSATIGMAFFLRFSLRWPSFFAFGGKKSSGAK